MYENCLFCRIISGDIPSAKVYEDEYVCATSLASTSRHGAP